MSDVPRGVCRFFAQSQQCKFGKKCKFSHQRPGDASIVGGPARSSSSSNTPGRPNGAPPGTCNFYWTTGSCNRSFDCSFKHVKGTAAAASTSTITETEVEEPLDFFSAEGLAVNGGATRLTLDPASAHNNIQLFLRDNFRFESASTEFGLDDKLT